MLELVLWQVKSCGVRQSKNYTTFDRFSSERVKLRHLNLPTLIYLRYHPTLLTKTNWRNCHFYVHKTHQLLIYCQTDNTSYNIQKLVITVLSLGQLVCPMCVMWLYLIPVMKKIFNYKLCQEIMLTSMHHLPNRRYSTVHTVIHHVKPGAHWYICRMRLSFWGM